MSSHKFLDIDIIVIWCGPQVRDKLERILPIKKDSEIADLAEPGKTCACVIVSCA